jgi:outer membrane protein
MTSRSKLLAARICATLALGALSGAASAADIIEVYQRALQSDPIIREADANRLANLEARPQARAGLLPQLTATGAANKSKSDGSSTFPIIDDTTGAVAFVERDNKTDVDTVQWSIQLRQTLFRWDRWSQLKRADKVAAQAEVDYKSAQQDLISRVSTRYFDVLAAKDTVDAAEATLEAFKSQLEQADKRFEVGLIAITDVQETRAAHDQAAASVIAAKRSLATAQELLRELTGEAFDQLAPPIEDMPLKTPVPDTEEQWVTAALDQNLRVLSARLGADIAKQDVNVARSGHLPSIDIVASHGDRTQDGTQTTSLPGGAPTRSPNNADGQSDTIGVEVTFPIYSGGGTSSQVRQRVYLHRAARERLERANRETERATRDAYLGVLSEISRVQALKQALASSQTALQATEAGFEVGTRTTVDVLDARRQLFTAQTNYSRSRYDYIINVLNLKGAAGTLSMKDLEEINGSLKH